MKIKIPKIIRSLVLFLICMSATLHAADKRVGLALYDVASGENVDYLKKVVKESLGASLQMKGYTIVDIPLTEDEIKRRGVAGFLKKDNLDALVAGSIIKVGSNVQIFSRVYTLSGATQPAVLTSTALTVDALLGTLSNHSQLIAGELSKNPQPLAVVSAPIETKTPPPEKVKPEKPLKETAVSIVAPASRPVPTPVVAPVPTPVVALTPEAKPAKVKTPNIKTDQALSASKEEIRETGAPNIPDYKWVSNVLSFEGRGMAYGDVKGDGQKEVVIADLKHVYVFEFTKNQLRLLKTYDAGENDAFVRVYTQDVNGDGKEEILVTNINRGIAASFVLELVGDEFKEVVKNAPWLIKTLNWNGNNIILGERFNAKLVEYHDIRQLKVENGKFKDMGKFEAPSEIGIYGLESFKSKNTEAEEMLYLTPSGYLKIYDVENGKKFKKKWSSSERYGGTSNFLRLAQTDMFNEVTNDFSYFNVEPVSLMGSDGYGSIFVPKNDDFLKNMIGTRPVVKNTWFTKLHWQDIGMREVYSTRKIDGYFADNIKVQLPWENQPKVLTLLWVRDRGFMNAMGTFKTVVAVYDL